MKLWLGIIIFVILTAPWFIALWQQAGSEYLKVFFLHNHLQRFLPGSLAGNISGAASGHHNPFYYYITEFPVGFLPWSILLVPVLIFAFSRHRFTAPESSSFDTNTLFLKCWFFGGIVFLSIASTKRTLYLMPIFAPMAALTGIYLERLLKAESLKRYEKVFLWFLSAVLIIAGLVLVPAYYYLSSQYFGQTPPVGFSFVLAVCAFLVCAAIVLGLFCLKHNSIRNHYVSIVISMTILFLSSVLYFFPLIDKAKSFIPFCKEVSSHVPMDQPLFAYQPDETLRAIIPFYTGHYVLETETTDPIIKRIRSGHPFSVVIRDRRSEAEHELAALNGLTLIAKYPMGSDKALVLFSTARSVKN